jgi:hypothetical protein
MALVFLEMMMVVDLVTNHSHDDVETVVVAAVVVGVDDEVIFVEDFGGTFAVEYHFVGCNLEETEQENLGAIFVPIPLMLEQRGMVMKTWRKHYLLVLLDNDDCVVLHMLSSQLLDLDMIFPPFSSQCTFDLYIYNSSCIIYENNNISIVLLLDLFYNN